MGVQVTWLFINPGKFFTKKFCRVNNGLASNFFVKSRRMPKTLTYSVNVLGILLT